MGNQEGVSGIAFVERDQRLSIASTDYRVAFPIA